MNNNNNPAAAATEYNSVYTNSTAVNDVQQNAAQTQAAAVGQTTTTTSIAAAAASLANNSSQGNVVDSPIIINMDNSSAGTNPLNNMQQPTIGSSITSSNNDQSSAMQRNFLPFLNEARARLGRQTSYPGSILNQTWHGGNRSQFDLHRTRTTLQMPEYNIPTNAPVSPSSPPPPVAVPAHLRQLRAWRMNINNMLTFSTAPSTETLRSLITHTRYVRGQGQRGGPDDNINLLLQDGNDHNGDPAAIDASSTTGGDRINGRTLRSFSDLGGASTSRQMLTPNSRLTNASNPELNRHIDDNELNATAANNTTQPPNNNNNSNNNSTNDDGVPVFDEDVISNAVVTILSHVVRYLPFIFILCLKFLYDHMEGILDLVFLHLIMHHMNKSLRKQVSKLSQKSYTIIFRDMTLILLVVIYRLIITTTPPDPFGLLITPPLVTTTVTVKLGPAVLGDTPVVSSQTTPAPKVASNIIEGLPLGLLLYYVAINDLVLKLLTILVKNIIVLMPTRIIRHKQRSRLYVILEYTSQLYRAMVPIHEWIKFLYESYTGLEVISGILFSTFYMCSKGFEFVHRGQPLKKAIMIFVRNLDSQRRPTVSELGSAGGVCPICHDNYDTPVVLECNHIFCDACVNTWFKREQTCPMCRAKINIDPNWEDGATTYFYQLC